MIEITFYNVTTPSPKVTNLPILPTFTSPNPLKSYVGERFGTLRKYTYCLYKSHVFDQMKIKTQNFLTLSDSQGKR